MEYTVGLIRIYFKISIQSIRFILINLNHIVLPKKQEMQHVDSYVQCKLVKTIAHFDLHEEGKFLPTLAHLTPQSEKRKRGNCA